MSMRARAVCLSAGLAVAGVVRRAPAPVARDRTVTVDVLVEELRGSGLSGRELADAAIEAVSKEFPYHSVWHLWEAPERALSHGRGWSHQYNRVLASVLEHLGFETRLVHAARVQGWRHPWFFSSHMWVKVGVERRWLDACASRATNTLGNVGFTPVSEELPLRTTTHWTVALGLAPAVVGGVWRAWLTRQSVPPWIYRRRD